MNGVNVTQGFNVNLNPSCMLFLFGMLMIFTTKVEYDIKEFSLPRGDADRKRGALNLEFLLFHPLVCRQFP